MNRLSIRISAIIAALSLPFIFAVLPRVSESPLILVELSALAGYLSAVVLLLQYMLGTRTVAGLVTRDMVGTIGLHKNLGIYGIILFILHPILIMVANEQSLSYLITIDFSTPLRTAITYGRIALILIVLTWVLSAVLRSKIAYRPWKYLHYLVYAILPLIFLHAPRAGTILGEGGWLLWYWNALAAVFILCVMLRARFSFGFGKHLYSISSVRNLRPDTYEFILQTDGSTVSGVTPGQYVYVQHRLFGEEHPFSVVHAQGNTLTLAFTAYGRFTKQLAKLTPGERVYIDGPYGVFTQGVATLPDTQPVVFVAGGIGITPFMQHLQQAKPSWQLLYANRDRSHTAYRSEVASSSASVTFVDAAAPQPGHSGYIDSALITATVQSPTTAQWYLCGPPPMVRAVTRALRELGVPQNNIATESFSH
jgi:predicted ferric reductase